MNYIQYGTGKMQKKNIYFSQLFLTQKLFKSGTTNYQIIKFQGTFDSEFLKLSKVFGKIFIFFNLDNQESFELNNLFQYTTEVSVSVSVRQFGRYQFCRIQIDISKIQNNLYQNGQFQVCRKYKYSTCLI